MKTIIHGLTAGALASLASVIYFNLYQGTLLTAFDKIINVGAIIGSSVIGCLLMALAYFFADKIKKVKLKGILNILFLVLSFASIISPIAMSLPLDIESPELFPGLVIPMHFFPALAFLALVPFFEKKTA
jgi:hypothetical protein